MSLTLFNLTGRRALITGSSQGIGLALAKGLADAGASVVLNGRDEKKLKEGGVSVCVSCRTSCLRRDGSWRRALGSG